MAKFITLKLDNINEEIDVNIEKIVSFTRRPNMNYTDVELDGGKTITVAESPTMIREHVPT